MRITGVIVICLIAAACSATGPSMRPLESGFTTGAGVADPYGDGKRQLAAGRYEVAIERFRQALAEDRNSLDALNGLAIAYTRLGRFEIAQTYFERALQIDAISVSTLNNYGWSLIEQGRLREAKPFLELALRHADEADAPVVAANIETLGRPRPSALVAALESDSPPGALLGPHRLIRVDHNAYRLETTAAPTGQPEPATTAQDGQSPEGSLGQQESAIVSPAERPALEDVKSAPSVVTEGVDGAGFAPPSAEHVRAAEPKRDIPAKTPPGSEPIQLWPEPAPKPEAGSALAGD